MLTTILKFLFSDELQIFLILIIGPKEKNVLFPLTCPKFLGLVGRQTFFFIKTFLYGKSMKILKNSLKIDFNILKVFKKVLVGPKILGSVG